MSDDSRAAWRERGRRWAVTAGSVVLALLAGAVLMIASDDAVASQFAYLFTAPQLPLGAAWAKVSGAYTALFVGAVGSPNALAATAWQAGPLIVAGLGVGITFRAGLFNIGAQGQAVWGAIGAAYVGFALHLPPVIHLLVAVTVGLILGSVWGAIPGFLKARTGAHEVIVTIMMNFIATSTLAWLLATPAFQRPGRSDPIAPAVDATAQFPVLFRNLHLGFFVALAAAVLAWWLMDRSTIGFTMRAVGANPHAAATAGMSVPNTTVVAMALSGAFAGVAGILYALGPAAGGTATPLSAGLVGTVGFDALTVALLGRSRPVGTILAGLLFGGLHAGGLAMQSAADTPLTLATVLQALIVLFVAAPAIVTALMPKVKAPRQPALVGGEAA